MVTMGRRAPPRVLIAFGFAIIVSITLDLKIYMSLEGAIRHLDGDQVRRV
jgi:hypothetical protein